MNTLSSHEIFIACPFLSFACPFLRPLFKARLMGGAGWTWPQALGGLAAAFVFLSASAGARCVAADSISLFSGLQQTCWVLAI